MEKGTEKLETVASFGGVSDAKWKPELDRPRGRWTLMTVLIFLVFLVAAGALTVAVIALCRANDNDNSTAVDTEHGSSTSNVFYSTPLTGKIAFGSCTTYYLIPQTIWTTGVIPSAPDAWIWLGDMVYFDTSMNYCPGKDYEDLSDCMCERTLTRSPPYQCAYGNISFGQEKLRRQLYDNDFVNFLHYMCPGMDSKSFPPNGERCKKPIIGTYDDHDFGLNDGNRRLEYKYEYKNMFLDALGVEQGSPRRNRAGGLQTKYTFNSVSSLNRAIDVFLLDERYERDTLPCDVRREWCEGILEEESDKDSDDYIWCSDFIGPDGKTGSCCAADDIFANGWCKSSTKDKESDPLWDVACDPTSENYGSKQVEIDPDTNKLRERETYNREDLTYLAPFCDVLGIDQRKWFQQELLKSKAGLKIIASGSVIFADPRSVPNLGPCSGDDIDCYRQAQTNLIHTLNKVDNGCVIILVGDYHVSDIKMVQGGKQTYSDYYPTENLTRPIYQVMSSGLTETTAKYGSYDPPCSGWRKDELGLRPFGPCSVVVQPSFGMLEFDWPKRIVHLQLRSKETGEVTTAEDGSKQQLSIDLDTCQPVEET